jgi:H+/gluconate symporter-like permease
MFAPVAALLASCSPTRRGAADVQRRVHGKMVGFVKLYFPVFMLGAIFGKVIELSGFSSRLSLR